MEITEENIEKFRRWVVSRGRASGTADLYISNLKSCSQDPKGVTNRLVAGGLSPNSKRTNIAALRAWAKFAKNTELAEWLDEIKLPPPRRIRTKLPLGRDDLRGVVKHLRTCRMHCEPMRHVLLIIALRGIRSGDVLRIERREVVRALATGKLIYEGKGSKRIEIDARPINDQLKALAAIEKWSRVRDLVAIGKNGRAVSNKVWRASRRTAKQVGIADMNPHRYRHTFATNFLALLKGDPNAIVKLQQYMAWESMATAARYVDSISQNELDTIGADLIADVLG